MSETVELKVRVIPNASRDEIVGWHDGALKVKTRTAPKGGKANKAVCALIAEALQLPQKSVSVLRGQTNPNKILTVEGLSAEKLEAQLKHF